MASPPGVTSVGTTVAPAGTVATSDPGVGRYQSPLRSAMITTDQVVELAVLHSGHEHSDFRPSIYQGGPGREPGVAHPDAGRTEVRDLDTAAAGVAVPALSPAHTPRLRCLLTVVALLHHGCLSAPDRRRSVGIAASTSESHRR